MKTHISKAKNSVIRDPPPPHYYGRKEGRTLNKGDLSVSFLLTAPIDYLRGFKVHFIQELG